MAGANTEGSALSLCSNKTETSVAMTCTSQHTLRRPRRRPSLDATHEEEEPPPVQDCVVAKLVTELDAAGASGEEAVVTSAMITTKDMEIEDGGMDDTDDDSSCSSEHTQVTSNTNPHKSSVGQLGDHNSSHHRPHTSSSSSSSAKKLGTSKNCIDNNGIASTRMINTRPFAAKEDTLSVPTATTSATTSCGTNSSDLENSLSRLKVSLEVNMDASMGTKASAMTEGTDFVVHHKKPPLNKHERWSSGEANVCQVSPRGRRSSVSGSGRIKSRAGNKNGKRPKKSHKRRNVLEREPAYQEQDEEEDDDYADNPDDPFDLRSKPAIVGVRITTLEEESEFLVNDDDDDDDHLAPGSVGSVPSKKSQSSGSSANTNLVLTEDRVRSHMVDYYADYDSIFRHGKTSKSCWEAFFQQYFTEDVLWVRSTGNPIGREGLATLLSQDIIGISMSIVSIDSIQIFAGGLAAVVVFTADQEYIYRGTPESDRTVISSVLSVVNGCDILISHEHRCVGKPIPKDSRWES